MRMENSFGMTSSRYPWLHVHSMYGIICAKWYEKVREITTQFTVRMNEWIWKRKKTMCVHTMRPHDSHTVRFKCACESFVSLLAPMAAKCYLLRAPSQSQINMLSLWRHRLFRCFYFLGCLQFMHCISPLMADVNAFALSQCAVQSMWHSKRCRCADITENSLFIGHFPFRKRTNQLFPWKSVRNIWKWCLEISEILFLRQFRIEILNGDCMTTVSQLLWLNYANRAQWRGTKKTFFRKWEKSFSFPFHAYASCMHSQYRWMNDDVTHSLYIRFVVVVVVALLVFIHKKYTPDARVWEISLFFIFNFSLQHCCWRCWRIVSNRNRHRTPSPNRTHCLHALA